MNQKQRVLSHLMERGFITNGYAWANLSVGRLSDVILKLRADGHNIETVMRDGVNQYGEYKFGEYHLIKLAGKE